MKDKEQTKRKLIEAVGEIFRTEGHGGLGVNKVARLAGIDKKLIYRYFGSFDRLVEAYVIETDYWIKFLDHLHELCEPAGIDELKYFFRDVLKNQFLHFKENREMQQLIFWELTAKNNLMHSIHRVRELKGQQWLELADQYTLKENVNFRAVAALLVGGIYYLILHTRHNGDIFFDIDLSKENGRQDITKAIDVIIAEVFRSSNDSINSRLASEL